MSHDGRFSLPESYIEQGQYAARLPIREDSRKRPSSGERLPHEPERATAAPLQQSPGTAKRVWESAGAPRTGSPSKLIKTERVSRGSWPYLKDQLSSQLYEQQASPAAYPSRSITQQIDEKSQLDARKAAKVLPHLDLGPSRIVPQPISQTITQPQLAAEVKAIYHALVQIEGRCVNVLSIQFAALQEKPLSPAPLIREDWQSLTTMHRTLLHEHHDFFLASQHPSSSIQLREIASKYSMPARMWKHGIHNFLELLRRHLPHSMEYMLAFVYLAYQMMALLFETVPSYEDTWMECLGDLGRYRMAIEEEDPRDREIWTGVARSWYCKAVDKNFHVGRLYHHLAILARTNAVEQLSLYGRSLVAIQPFPSSMSPILTLLEPIAARKDNDRSPSADVSLVKAHACIFLDKPYKDFLQACEACSISLDPSIIKLGYKWRDQGTYVAVADNTSMLGWGMQSALREACERSLGLLDTAKSVEVTKHTNPPTATMQFPPERIEMTRHLSSTISRQVFGRSNDVNILAFTHVKVAFFATISQLDQGWKSVQPTMHVRMLCEVVNQVVAWRREVDSRPIEASDPLKDKTCRPIFEEYQMRGQIWAPSYLQKDFFRSVAHDEDERRGEGPESHLNRLNRIIHLSRQVASVQDAESPWLRFDNLSNSFSIR